MRKFYLFRHSVFLCLALGQWMSAYSANPGNPPSNWGSGVPVVIGKVPTGGTSSTRPRKPSSQHIACEYQDGWLNIQFKVPEGNGLLIVTETNSAHEDQMVINTNNDIFVYVGELHDAYIKISTSFGNIYGGIMHN